MSFDSNYNDPSETSRPSVVEVTKNGPLMIKGSLRVKMPDGSERVNNKMTALCRCGDSSNKPFCDGTHNKNGFEG